MLRRAAAPRPGITSWPQLPLYVVPVQNSVLDNLVRLDHSIAVQRGVCLLIGLVEQLQPDCC